MKSLRIRLTFPPGPATEPVIYQIVKQFDVVSEQVLLEIITLCPQV